MESSRRYKQCIETKSAAEKAVPKFGVELIEQSDKNKRSTIRKEGLSGRAIFQFEFLLTVLKLKAKLRLIRIQTMQC